MRIDIVAFGRAAIAAARPDGAERMRAQYPIANIDGVDILLDDDVARKHAILQPVADAQLLPHGAGILRIIRQRAIVMRGAANDVAQRSLMDALHQLDERRRGTNLEAHIEAQPPFRLLADLEHALRAGDIHRYRLFAIDVLARGHHRRQMLGMEIRRRRNHDGVHVFRFRHLLVGFRAHESRGGIRIALPHLVQLVLIKIAEREDAGIR